MIPAVWNHVSLCAWNSVLGKCEHKVKDNQEWLIIYSITAKSKSNPQPMDMRRAKVNLKQELSQGSSYSPLSSEGQSCCYVIYRQKTKKQTAALSYSDSAAAVMEQWPASAVRWVENLIVEDGEVEGEPEADGVCGWQLWHG